MEKKTPTPMTPFDEWTVPKELHMLKLFLPYTPVSYRQVLGILIKVIELQYTVQYFDRQKNLLHEQNFSSGFSSPLEMLEEISPYLPPEQVNMLETFRNMMNIMDMVQMMQDFSDDPGNANPNPDSSDGEASFQETADSEKKGTSADFGGSGKGMPFMGFGGSGNAFDPMQLVMGMLSPEQKDMFEMYQTMFSQPAEPDAAQFSSDGKENFSDHTFTDMEGDTDAEQAERDIQNVEAQDDSSQNIESQNAESQDRLQNMEFQNAGSQDIDIERMDTDYE